MGGSICKSTNDHWRYVKGGCSLFHEYVWITKNVDIVKSKVSVVFVHRWYILNWYYDVWRKQILFSSVLTVWIIMHVQHTLVTLTCVMIYRSSGTYLCSCVMIYIYIVLQKLRRSNGTYLCSCVMLYKYRTVSVTFFVRFFFY